MTGEIRKEPEMRTIVLVDAVNFTNELKTYGRPTIAPKIKQLKEFTEFFFVYKLKGKFIGQMGDGFLVLCPPTPAEVITEALSCLSFVSAYNFGLQPPTTLNTRIAIHFGMISPPERGNYIDTNLNLTARLEGATPPNTVCISSTLYDIVADSLREITFEELKSDFRGLGENKYYKVLGSFLYWTII
jgi:class 3 adenylate cyclase